MKKVYYQMVILISCLLLSGIGTTLYGQTNLLGNPSFETGELAPWTAGNGNTVNIIEDAADGTYAAQGNIEQIINLVAGQAYVWTAQVKCVGGCDKNMWIGVKDLAPEGGVTNFNFQDFNEYGEAKIEFVAENTGQHRFWVWGQGGEFDYVSDNHVLYTAEDAAIANNLLGNPGFETGELAPWIAGNDNTVNIIGDAPEGNFAAQGNIEQIIDLKEGQAYVWTAQVKCLGGCDKNMWIGVKDLAPDGGVKNFNFQDFSEFGEAKIEFVAENTGPHRFWVWGQGGELDYVSDNHILIEVDEVTPEPEPEPEGEGFGDNLLLNPSFETGELEPWIAANGNTVNLISGGPDGEFAAQGNIEQIVNLEAGQSYVWTAQVKCLGGCDEGMFIGVRDLVAEELVKNFRFSDFGEYGEAKIVFKANSTGEHRFFVFGVGAADYVSDNHVLQKTNASGEPESGEELGPVGDNLLINPSFETGVLDPWTGAPEVIIAEGAQEGTYAARGNIEQIVNLEEGKSYVWTAQVKCLGGCDKNMWIGIKDLVADELVTNFLFSDYSEYGEAKIEFTAKSSGEHRFWVWGVGGTEYVSDNHVLKKLGVVQRGPVGDNLLINPSFETGELNPWTAGGLIVGEGAQEGTYAAQGNIEQIVNLEEGESYVWTAQVKCLGGCDKNMWIGIKDLVADELVTNFLFSEYSEYGEAKIEFTAKSTGEHRFWVWGVGGTEYVSDNHVLKKIGIVEIGPVGDNLIINPSFETSVLAPWTAAGLIIGEGAQDGAYAAQGNIEQIVNLEEGVSYVWTAQVKCLGGCDMNMWIGIKDLVADELVTNFLFSEYSEYGEAKIEFTAKSTGEHRFWVWGVNGTDYVSDNHVLRRIGIVGEEETTTTSTYEIGTDADKIAIINYSEGLMISIDPTIDNALFYAHDLGGRMVHNRKVNDQTLISKSHFRATGIYIISVRAGNAIKTQKVFIKAE